MNLDCKTDYSTADRNLTYRNKLYNR